MAAVLAALSIMQATTPYEASIEAWRQAREQSLKAPDGWLTVAGLFWLKEGENRFGSDPENRIALPAPVPQQAGAFVFHKGKVEVRIAPGVAATLNDHPVTTAALRTNRDVLKIGDSVSMFVIERGGRYAIRMRDQNSEMRRNFSGLHWYPVKPEYRVVAEWIPYDPPKQIPILNIVGITEQQTTPGKAKFRLNGVELTLEPVLEGDQLFFIFRDQTSGHGTYGAGRFLYADLAKDGKVVLDFNKAYNPPCAFTAFATCPLPPKQNHLAIQMEAGELNYGHE